MTSRSRAPAAEGQGGETLLPNGGAFRPKLHDAEVAVVAVFLPIL